MKIDIMIPMGPGSLWDNTELRYCLRSIEKHLTEYRDIYIVGELPTFVKGINHISLGDDHPCKETNIYRKVLRACQEKSISDDFLFFNDDHFLLKNFIATEYPFYYKRDLRTTSKGLRAGSPYKQAIDNTYRVLHEENKLPTKNFDGHCPIIYNKKFMLDRITKYDWSGKISYILKSLYANTKLIDGELGADCKINSQHTIEGLHKIIDHRVVFSMGDGAIGDPMKSVLDELYSVPSRWEK